MTGLSPNMAPMWRHFDTLDPMPPKELRDQRINLRTTPSILALAQEMADLGHVSLNTAVNQLIVLGAPEYRRRFTPPPESAPARPARPDAGPSLFREPPSAPADES